MAMMLTATLAVSAQTTKPAPCGPVPNEDQLRWQAMEMYAFIHYSQNTYTFTADGRVQVDADYRPTADSIPLIPKFGMRLHLPADYTDISYYGRGPFENYPDRKRAAFIGHYQMPLADFETEYVKPQDNGYLGQAYTSSIYA